MIPIRTIKTDIIKNEKVNEVTYWAGLPIKENNDIQVIDNKLDIHGRIIKRNIKNKKNTIYKDEYCRMHYDNNNRLIKEIYFPSKRLVQYYYDDIERIMKVTNEINSTVIENKYEDTLNRSIIYTTTKDSIDDEILDETITVINIKNKDELHLSKFITNKYILIYDDNYVNIYKNILSGDNIREPNVDEEKHLPLLYKFELFDNISYSVSNGILYKTETEYVKNIIQHFKEIYKVIRYKKDNVIY